MPDGLDAMEGITLDELEQKSGVSARTIRYYMLNGLLAGPTGQGPAARYPVGHVERLRAIRVLQDQGRQLASIRTELDSVTDEDLAANRWQPAPPKSPTVSTGRHEGPFHDRQRGLFPASPRSEPPVSRSQWERFELEPGVELHVRRPLSTSANRRIQKLLRMAEDLKAATAQWGDKEV